MEMAKRMMRLDKYLADMKVGTRSEVKKLIRKGLIQVNETVIKSPEYKVQLSDEVVYQGQIISYKKHVYYMLHKPKGVVSATEDNFDTTVLELLEGVNTECVFPVGRLDKDTEGLLLLTNNGDLAHQLLSPKKHVAKKYLAHVQGVVTQDDVKLFHQGLEIGEKNPTLPAVLEVLESDEISQVHITICEGKFHQIKRMFHAVGKEVIYLKRLQMGTLMLDENLKPGTFRSLTKEEVEALC